MAYSQLQKREGGAWRTVLAHTTRTSYSFLTRVDHTYDFRVQAVNTAGQTSRWASGLVVGRVT